MLAPPTPGECECVGADYYRDPQHPWPEDYGMYCRVWLGDYSCACEGNPGYGSADCPVEDDWGDDWCTKKFCLVEESCATGSSYAGTQDRWWSEENCIEAFVATTKEPESEASSDDAAATTASP